MKTVRKYGTFKGQENEKLHFKFSNVKNTNTGEGREYDSDSETARQPYWEGIWSQVFQWVSTG